MESLFPKIPVCIVFMRILEVGPQIWEVRKLEKPAVSNNVVCLILI